MSFEELRLSLADARAVLRHAKDSHEVAKAEAEQQAIESGAAGGKNEAERHRSLSLALAHDTAYRQALRSLRATESEVERLEALLEGARDARRAEEWAIRARLADALLQRGVQSDEAERAGDQAFDDATIGRIVDEITGEVIGRNGDYDLPF